LEGTKKLTMAFANLTKTVAGATGVIGGATAAGLYALNRAAQTTQQRAFVSNAMGINPHDLMRMKATYGQLGNMESMMGAISAERTNPASRFMAQLGYTPGQAQKADIFNLKFRNTQEQPNPVHN
jgi:hypothetical protein